MPQAFSAILVLTIDWDRGPSRHGRRRGSRRTAAFCWQNEDATNFFYYNYIPAGQAGETIDRYVDVLAEAGVTVLLWNTNARRTNYRSDVWQAFWDGYDPAGPDDQPFLAPIPAEQRAQMWAQARRQHARGASTRHRLSRPGDRAAAGMRHVPLDHAADERRSLQRQPRPSLSQPLWRRLEMLRQGAPGYFARALDYAHPEVRDHYRALIVETLERYDVDGLELDFMREPYLFSAGKEPEGRLLLTAWLREIRGLVDTATKRRGHRR